MNSHGNTKIDGWSISRLCRWLGSLLVVAMMVDLAVAQTDNSLSPDQRGELQRAARLNQQSVQLHGEEKYAEAANVAKDALSIRRSLLGTGHEDTWRSLQNVAILSEKLQDYPRAGMLWRELVKYQRDVLGAERQDARKAIEALAKLLGDKASRHEAEQNFSDALDARREVLRLRNCLYEEGHWRIVDARGAVKHLQRLQELSPKQRDKLAEAERLQRQLLELYGHGQYEQAITPAQEARQIRQSILGEDDLEYVTSLNNLATIHVLLGNHAKAEPLYRQAKQILQQVLGRRHPTYASSLNNLAALYQSVGDYAQAEPLYRQAMEIRKQVLDKEHPHYAASLDNLALLYESIGDYARAEPLCRQAMEIREQVLGEEHPDYATSLNNLAAIYHSNGDYAQAVPLHRQAIEIRKQVLGEEHPDYAQSLHNLASLYRSMGDTAQAETLYRQAMEIVKKVLGEEHPHYAASLHNLAMLYQSMDDYARAEPMHRQAMEIQKQVFGEEHREYAASLGNLALLYESIGDYAQAEPLCRQAMEIREEVLGEEHPHYAASLHNLAALYQSTGDYAQAEPMYRQAIVVCKQVLGEEHPQYASGVHRLAALYRSMGDYSKAGLLFRRALQISRKSLDDTALVLSERQQLAMGQMLRHQLDDYVSLTAVNADFEKRAFAQVLRWKGATLVRQRQFRKVAQRPDVAPLFKQLQSVAMQLASLSRSVPEDPDKSEAWQSRVTELRSQKEKLEAELSRRSATFRKAKRQITPADVITALPDSAALVDFLEYRKSTPSAEQEGQWDYERSLVAFVVRSSGDVRMFDLGPAAPVSEAIDTWRKTFGLSAEGKAAGRVLRETIWEPLLSALEGSETVLVSPDGVLGRLPLGALPGKEPESYLLEEHRLALLPVPQLLPALVTEEGRQQVGKGLLLMGDVDYDAEPQEEEMPKPERRKGWRRSPPDAGVDAAQSFAPLGATAGEVARLEVLFRDLFGATSEEIVTLKDASASESRFRELAPQCYHLHLATHGFFASPKKKSALAPEVAAQSEQDHRQLRGAVYGEHGRTIRGVSPHLLSGLAFAGANREPEAGQDDGILTAEEIAFLPLGGADLVTLSACETGLGEVAGGEGLLGVQRSFQVSGARSTVASLWKVDDVATRQLMERFYRNYWEKEMSKLDALREAQLWMLDDPDAIRGAERLQPEADEQEELRRTPPQFWAAFTLSGD